MAADELVPQIRQIFESARTRYERLEQRDGRGAEQQDERRRPRSRKDLRQYFHTVQVAAQESNRVLEQKQSLYRLRVYERWGKVMIAVQRLDLKGKVVSETIKDITHGDFARWIEDISQMEGLLFDGMA